MTTLPRFYPVLPSARWVERALIAGARFIQLRVKNTPEELLRRETIYALALCQEHGAQLVLNDYWQLAIELNVPWLHVGQEDLATTNLQAVRAAGIKLGISTHSHEELDKALTAQPDYVALGPIYPTKLKKMPWKPQGLERVAEWKQRIGNLPLCAIGGLSVERAAGVFAAGADMAAAVTDITLHEAPDARLNAWVEACQ